jgi:hypothetical protein
MRPRETCKYTLAAAIFCYENGGTEAAVRYAQKVLDTCPHMADEVYRLLPVEI